MCSPLVKVQAHGTRRETREARRETQPVRHSCSSDTLVRQTRVFQRTCGGARVTCGSCMREQPTCQSACSIEGGRRAQPQLEREACSPFLPILAPVLTLPKELTLPRPSPPPFSPLTQPHFSQLNASQPHPTLPNLVCPLALSTLSGCASAPLSLNPLNPKPPPPPRWWGGGGGTRTRGYVGRKGKLKYLDT